MEIVFNILGFLSILAVVVYLFKKFIEFLKGCFLSMNFTNYTGILNYHMEKAYNMVHKDKVLVFSLEGLRPKEEELDAIAKDFVNLSIKLLGNKFYKDLCDLYGGEDSLLLNIFEYFNTRFEDDEIRESTLNKLSETDQEEPKNDG